MAEEKYTPQQMIDALREAGGVMTAAARKIGCSRHTVRRYVDEYPKVREVLEEENETNLDEGENTLIDYVRGVTTIEVDGERVTKPVDDRTRLDALKFYLRTKGRSRGYGDRIETDHSGGVAFELVYSDEAKDLAP